MRTWEGGNAVGHGSREGEGGHVGGKGVDTRWGEEGLLEMTTEGHDLGQRCRSSSVIWSLSQGSDRDGDSFMNSENVINQWIIRVQIHCATAAEAMDWLHTGSSNFNNIKCKHTASRAGTVVQTLLGTTKFDAP